MINWKELEKFIAPGKVMTLVILIDGKEVGALSFNVDSLAYKASLESKPIEPVKIADKKVVSSEIKKAETERKESLQSKKSVADKNDKTKTHPEFNPTPATAEDNKDDDDEEEENNENVDEETGEVTEEVKTETVKEVAHSEKQTSGTKGDDGKPEKRLTREEIMAQSETAAQSEPKGEPQGTAKKEPEKKVIEQAPADQTFGEEW